jgi:hypothetical protein
MGELAEVWYPEVQARDRGWVRIWLPNPSHHPAYLELKCTACQTPVRLGAYTWSTNVVIWHSWLAMCRCERFYWSLCEHAPHD